MSESRSTSRRLRPSTVVVLALIGLLVAVAAAFFLTGGRGYVVRTPSMGTAAPVGTLVLSRPTSIGDVRVGDVIVFHPPTSPDETFTHRVVARTDAGLRTRGDINGAADPWTVTGKDLVGTATVTLPRLGWLVRGLPYLIVGGLLVWWLTRTWVTPRRRGPARQFGAAVVFLLTVIVLRPFVGVAQLASTGDGAVSNVAVVSTGLLPVRLTPDAGSGRAAPLDLSMGEHGVSRLHGAAADGHYRLHTELHLTWLQWLIAVLICLSPLLWTLIVGFRPVGRLRPAAHRTPSTTHHRAATA